MLITAFKKAVAGVNPNNKRLAIKDQEKPGRLAQPCALKEAHRQVKPGLLQP